MPCSKEFLPFFFKGEEFRVRVHIIVYAVLIGFILLDAATTIIGFQRSGLTETNLLYRIVGFWAFPLVYLIDTGFLFAIEWLRKYIRWSPLIVFIPILAYAKACATNLQLLSNGI
jgi:hypothetical protein